MTARCVSAVVLTLTSLGVMSCSKPEQEARKRFDFLKANHASLGEICDAGREMVRAYSTARAQNGYQTADIDANNACLSADLDGREQRYGRPVIEADNLEMMPDTTTDAPMANLDNEEIGRENWQGE